MNTTRHLLIPLLLSFICSSFVHCRSDAPQGVLSQAQAFMTALGHQDLESMIDIYPHASGYEVFFASDSSTYVGCRLQADDVYEVSYDSYYVNEDNLIEYTPVKLWFKQRMNGEWYIADSYNIACFLAYPFYNLGVKTGCLTEDEVSDLENSTRIQIAEEILIQEADGLIKSLKTQVKLINTEVHQEGEQVKVDALVSNNSEFTFYQLGYSIHYYDSEDQPINTQTGLVTEDYFEPGEQKVISFFPNYHGLGVRVEFEFDFDVETVMEYVLFYHEFSGEEYHDFVNQSMVQL